MTRRSVTVALNGDAGDELFAGYQRYLAFKLAGRLGKIPSVKWQARRYAALLRQIRGGALVDKAKRFLPSLAFDGANRYLIYMVFFNDEERMRLYGPQMRGMMTSWDAAGYLRRIYESCRSGDEIAKVLCLDLHSYLPEDLLVKVDIATMAVSLEARSPFLDHRVVEFAASLPSRWKLRGRTSKYILKDVFGDLLPGDILRRGKMGFGVPIGRWFREELRGYLREVLLDPASLSRGYFDAARVRELVDEHQEGIRNHAPRLWALLMLELWHREFIDGSPSSWTAAH
jgi:asparagine synthase (glutamine-hydrolysing)